MMTRLAALTLIFSLLAAPLSAAPLKPEEVPAPLKPWISWVLRGAEQQLCPAMVGNDMRQCQWPGALKLSLDDRGGRFEQAWRSDAAGWAFLPGGPEHWPQDARVDGAAAVVVRRDNAPAVWLKPGAHVLSGAFRWDDLPEQLAVHPWTGLVTLTLRGQAVARPQRDDSGELWLQARAKPAAAKEEAHLDVTVHRKLTDEEPLQLLTRVVLKVSGPNRELALSRALPEGFTPMSLVSPIPARLDADGRLRVQARAGLWEVTIAARAEPGLDKIVAPTPNGDWDRDEVWVFEARPDLRQADVMGPPSLDPQQTQLPPDWKSLPAYLMKPGVTLSLTQRRRGDDPPPADRLTITRELWLDFDGGGFSARDTINGTMTRGWRLEAAKGTDLGRVEIGGQDQFLTVLSTGGPAGLEVRGSAVSVTADSRFEGRRVPATGWRHDFDAAEARLRLPPGWRLLYAGGVDAADGTWTSAWTLLDFFMVLVCAGAFGKLFGREWGLAALAVLVLTWQESGAPQWWWVLALVAAALTRALTGHPEAGKWAKWAHRVLVAGLALACIPFAIHQARTALYPVLEQPWASVQPRSGNQVLASPPPMAAPMYKSKRGRAFRQVMGARGSIQGMIAGAASSLASEADYVGRMAENAPVPQLHMARDPNARVTTGAGLPYWSWSGATLSWQGPVPRDHRMSLWLLPPFGNSALSVLRIVGVALLALLLAGLPVAEWLSRLRGSKAALTLLLGLLLLPSPSHAQSAFPPRDMLDELRNRMLERPECAPNCAESPLLKVSVDGGWLKLSLSVQAAARSAVPLPSSGRDWVPARASLDGQPAGIFRQGDGSLWASVPSGAHELSLEGPLPERDVVQLGLPLRPHRVEAKLSGWSLQGLREDGRPDNTLQLTRAHGAQQAPASTQARFQGSFPPFLMVERTLRLGLSWTVETRVTRLTPAGTPIVMDVPLLPGEAVTTPDVRSSKGKAVVSMAPNVSQVAWSSVLAETDALELEAAKTSSWAESWRIEPGPFWHLEVSGVPAIHSGQEPRAYQFRPWPGEKVSVKISRPGPQPGQTLTVDQTVLTLTPGLRATDATLSLSLRSSRGGQHVVALPAGAELLSVTIDGQSHSLRLEGEKLSLPVQPGAHEALISWRQPGGMGFFFRAPAVDAGAPSVNSHVIVSVPGRRWTLLAFGRGLGPVVLFWSLLALAALGSWALAQTKLAPLTGPEWLLLAVGLMQDSPRAGLFVAAWLLLVGLRGRLPAGATPREKKGLQVFLAGMTFFAAIALFSAVSNGLLGHPDMQIAGNGSSSELLRWYLDRSGAKLPRPFALTLPLWLYRVGMLAWALWLAQSLLRWAPWAWGNFSAGGLWPKDEKKPG